MFSKCLKNTIYFFLYFLICNVYLFGNILFGQDTIKLNNNGKIHEIGHQTAFLEDENNKLVFEDVEKKPFQKLKGRVFEHKITSSPVWFRMIVHNATNEPREWILDFQKSEIQEAHLYYRDSEGKKHDFVSGLHYYPSEKAHSSVGICFPLEFPPKSTRILYVRLVNHSFLTYIPTLTPQKLYEKNLYHFYLSMGVFYGLFLVVFFYNIINYFNTQKVFYLYFVGFMMSFMVLTGGYDGIIFNIFPQIAIITGGFQTLVFAGLFCITFSKFLEKYLEPSEKLFQRSIKGFFMLGFGYLFLGLLRLTFGFRLLMFGLPFAGFVFYQVLVFIWKNKSYVERLFFFVAFGVLFFSICVSILANEHFIPVSYVTRSALHWGFVGFVFSILLGLQYQIREKDIKIRAQELINQEFIKNKNIELQQEVDARTQELAQKELNIRGVIESTHDLIYALDKDFNILVFNSAARNNAKTLYNIKLEPGQNYLAIMPSDIQKLMEKSLLEVLNKKKPVFTQQQATMHGRKIYRDIFLNPIFDDYNQIVGLSVFSKDVTQSSHTRKELQYSQIFLQTIFDNSPDALFLISQNNYVVEKCNETAIKMFEANSAHDLLGNKGGIFHYNNLSEEENQLILKSIKQTGHWEGEYYYTTQKGNHFWGNIILTTFELQNKAYQLARITDITQKKRIEQDLKNINHEIMSKQANLTALLENNDFAIWLVDDKGQLVDGNFLYKKLYFDCYGYESPKSESLAFRFGRAEKIAWTHRFISVLQGNEGVYLEKRKIKGKIHHFSIKAFPVKQNNKIIGASFFAQDISKNIEADRKLKRRNKSLKKVNLELDKFVYRASHDLRAPLSSMLGLVKLLELEDLSPKNTEYLSFIKKSINKLDNFIAQIVDYSRNSRIAIAPELVDLEEMLQKTFENLQFMPQASRIQQEVNIQLPNKKMVVDVFRLEIILNNLISNAFRYANTSQEVPFVSVNIFLENNYLVFEIKDNGQGIEEKHFPKIFDMFYRATDQNTGSGLGLYIVKEAVDTLKGSIQLTSTYRKGTTFVVKIPRN